MFENIRIGMGICHQGFEDSGEAAFRAAEQALAGLGAKPSVLLIFGSAHYAGKHLARGICGAVGQTPAVGVSCAYQVADELLENSLVVAAVASPFLAVRIGVGGNVLNRPVDAAEEACEDLLVSGSYSSTDDLRESNPAESKAGFGLVFFPPVPPEEPALSHMRVAVEDLRKRLSPRAPIFFGFAATARDDGTYWQLAKGRSVEGALVVALFHSALEVGIGFAHGLVENIELSSRVTKAADGVALELHGRSFEELFGGFGSYQVGSTRNRLVLCSPSGRGGPVVPVRVSTGTPGSNRLSCDLELAVGTEFFEFDATSRRIIEAARRAARRSIAAPNVRNPVLVLVTSTQWRCKHLGNESAEEVLTAKKVLSNARIVGGYTDSVQLICSPGYDSYCAGVFGSLAIGSDPSVDYVASVQGGRLLRAAYQLLVAKEPEFVFQGIADVAFSLLECKTCTLRILNPETGQLELKGVRGISEKRHRQDYPALPVGYSIVGKVAQTGKRMICLDLLKDDNYKTPELARVHALQAMFCEPILSAENTVGALTVYYERAEQITPLRLETASSLCRLAGAALAELPELQSIHALCRELPLCKQIKEAAVRLTACAFAVLKCDAVELHCQDSMLRSYSREAWSGDAIPEGDYTCASSARERAVAERMLTIVPGEPSGLFSPRLAASVPLVVGQEVVGTLTAMWQREGSIAPEKWVLLEALAARVTPALNSIILAAEHDQITQLMAGIGPAARKRVTARTIISQVLKTVRRELGIGSVVLYLWRDQEKAYLAAEAYGFKRKNPILKGRWSRFSPGDGIVGLSAQQNRNIVVNIDNDQQPPTDPYLRHLQANVKSGPLRLCIAVPMGSQPSSTTIALPVGVLVVVDNRQASVDPRAPFRPSANAALSGLGQRVQTYLELLRLEDGRTKQLLSSAHQLRSPLATVGGYLETMELSGISPDVMRSAKASVVQALHMVDVRTHADRIAAGLTPMRREQIDLRAVVDQVVAVYLPLAQKRDLHLLVTRPNQSVVFEGDKAKVRAILDNLCSNALEYCSSGNTVEIILRAGSPIELSIRDTGPGLPDVLGEAFGKGTLSVFEPHPGKNSQGLGMGLAIVREYADDLGWACRLDSSPTEGTSFTFSIPAERGRRTKAARVRGRAEPNARGGDA